MSRIKDAIIAPGTEGSYTSSTYGVMNLAHGGQNGYLPKLGKLEEDGMFQEWISNQAYVKRNMIPVVLSYPKFFDFMPNPRQLISAYKALIELHPLTIDGLSTGLTVETDEHAVGGGGEMQEEIVNVLRNRSSLSFTYKEKAGKSIQRFLDMIIRYGYMDPDTKKPLVANYITSDEAISKLGDMYTPEFYTGTVMFIEPDVTHTKVVDAWLCTNMFFKSNGERTGKRDIHSSGETLDLSIESSCITLNNDAVLMLGQSILSKLTVINQLPDTDINPTMEDISSGVADAQTGFSPN